MRATAVMAEHPNAAVAFVSTGPATLLVWAIGEWWPQMPNEVAASAAGILITAALLSGRSIRRFAGAVNQEGLLPLLSRLLRGSKPSPPPPATPEP